MLLIVNSYFLVVMASMEFLSEENATMADYRHPAYSSIVLIITIFFAVAKVKMAVTFCSRSLLLASYFNSLGVIVLLAQILDANTMNVRDFNAYVVAVVASLSAYLGFKTLAVSTFSLHLPYWRVSW